MLYETQYVYNSSSSPRLNADRPTRSIRPPVGGSIRSARKCSRRRARTDWNPLPQDDFAERRRKLVARPRWLIEGNYASTLPIRLVPADTVIFLDLPAITCLAGILQRRWR
jgi:hypothetical protein